MKLTDKARVIIMCLVAMFVVTSVISCGPSQEFVDAKKKFAKILDDFGTFTAEERATYLRRYDSLQNLTPQQRQIFANGIVYWVTAPPQATTIRYAVTLAKKANLAKDILDELAGMEDRILYGVSMGKIPFEEFASVPWFTVTKTLKKEMKEFSQADWDFYLEALRTATEGMDPPAGWRWQSALHYWFDQAGAAK